MGLQSFVATVGSVAGTVQLSRTFLTRQGMFARVNTPDGPKIVKLEAPTDAPSTSNGPKFNNWNDFQAGTKGQFSSRSDAAKAWDAYKEAYGIGTGTVRSQAAKQQFLRSMADDPNIPSWMKQWLSEQRVPPGYEIDHIRPLSIGGPDTPANMRLQGIDLHRRHHYHYHPWRNP